MTRDSSGGSFDGSRGYGFSVSSASGGSGGGRTARLPSRSARTASTDTHHHRQHASPSVLSVSEEGEEGGGGGGRLSLDDMMAAARTSKARKSMAPGLGGGLHDESAEEGTEGDKEVEEAVRSV